MLPEIVDQLRIFAPPRGVQHQRLFVHDHLGEADDRVQRRAQLMAHGSEETRLCSIRGLGCSARENECLLLQLAVGDVAHDGDNLEFGSVRRMRRRLEGPATHLDPDEVDRAVRAALDARYLALEAELHAARFTDARGGRQRGEIGRPVGDMNAIEQAMAEQLLDRRSQEGLGSRRNELYRAVAVMARDHVAHVARQQAVAFFFHGQERDAGARQELHAEGKARGIERGRSNAERHAQAAQRGADFGRRQDTKVSEQDQDDGAAQCKRGGEADHAARGRERRFDRDDDKPDGRKGFDAAGGGRDCHHETGERNR